MMPADFLAAARVPATITPQTFGLWTIERWTSDSILGAGVLGLIGWPDFTLLRRVSSRTLHLQRGEVVMEDSRRELRRHLPIWLNAYGDVLITGLGLGCVVRGLLASPRVEHVDVIEIDRQIIRVIGAEFAGNPRVTIHQGDALTFDLPGRAWDYAWHDLWTDGDLPLQLLHAQLIARFLPRCQRQGAWLLPRLATRRLPPHLARRMLGIPRSRFAARINP